MRFLLIGGIGYLGGRLSKYLKSHGHHVRVTTRRPLSEVPDWVSADEVVQSDLRDSSALLPLLSNADIVIHLAAPDEVAAAKNPFSAITAGVEVTWHVLESFAQKANHPIFIYLSTFHVYGKNATGEVHENMIPVPVHPYALGKYFGEGIVQLFRHRHSARALCVRLSNAFGAPEDIGIPRWSLVFNDLCMQAVKEKRLTLKSAGAQQRNFITLHDTARAIEFLSLHCHKWPDDGIIDVGSTLHMSIKEAAEAVAIRCEAVLGYKPSIVMPSTSESPGETFKFNVERLSAMGFTWINDTQEEIDKTLKLCAGTTFQ